MSVNSVNNTSGEFAALWQSRLHTIAKAPIKSDVNYGINCTIQEEQQKGNKTNLVYFQ